MGRVSEETVRKVLEANDLLALISSYIPVKKSGTTFQALCPFHHEKTPSFHINPMKQYYRCFGCGEYGNAIGFIMKYENLPFLEALQKLAQRAGIFVEEDANNSQSAQEKQARKRLFDLLSEAARWFHQLLRTSPEATHARDYLNSRGYNSEMAKRWQVGWCPENQNQINEWARKSKFSDKELLDSGLARLRYDNNPSAGVQNRFRDRLMFPIANEQGNIIGFSGRILKNDPTTGKYINSPETALFHKSRTFFGLDKARRAMSIKKFALLCEGQIDVIACHEAGFEQAVATLGTAFTAEHAKLLYRCTQRVVVCFDADKAGIAATDRAYRELVPAGLRVDVAKLPEGDDPDSFIRREGVEKFQAQLALAKPFFDAKIEMAQESGRIFLATGRAEFAHELAGFLSLMPDQIERGVLTQEIAARLRIGQEDFRQSVDKAKLAPRVQIPDEVDSAQNIKNKEVLKPTQLERVVVVLCELALTSFEAQEFFDERYEDLHEALETVPGIQLLLAIIKRRPNPNAAAEVQAFLLNLPDKDRLALEPLLEARVPENPVAAASEALGRLAFFSVRKKLEIAISSLNAPNLSEEEKLSIQKSVLDLQLLMRSLSPSLRP